MEEHNVVLSEVHIVKNLKMKNRVHEGFGVVCGFRCSFADCVTPFLKISGKTLFSEMIVFAFINFMVKKKSKSL